MPTRKQRRRREKSFRHDYEYVLVDDEGNEVAVEESPAKRDAAEKPASSKGKATTPQRRKGAASTRSGRVVQPASWRRVGKRGLIFAPLMFVTVLVIDRGVPYWQVAFQTLWLMAIFLPFSYFMDSFMYRRYTRRTGDDRPGR